MGIIEKTSTLVKKTTDFACGNYVVTISFGDLKGNGACGKPRFIANISSLKV